MWRRVEKEEDHPKEGDRKHGMLWRLGWVEGIRTARRDGCRWRTCVSSLLERREKLSDQEP